MKFRHPIVLIAAAGGLLLIGLMLFSSAAESRIDAAVLVSANAEWTVVKAIHPRERFETSPFGEYFFKEVRLPGGGKRSVVVLHGGWGKVSAAASTQYVIDRWNPELLINVGTCGGFEGAIERGAVILVERTVIYDIIERMGDAEEAVRDYATALDLDWLTPPFPTPVVRSALVSADQDLDPAAIPNLKSKYGAAAGDWESGAIAYVAKKNNKRLLILRGVTDLVGVRGGEAYGKIEVFRRNTETIMKRLFADLPAWLKKAKPGA
jgi:adenosylhomocysteine nucleosidase